MNLRKQDGEYGLQSFGSVQRSAAGSCETVMTSKAHKDAENSSILANVSISKSYLSHGIISLCTDLSEEWGKMDSYF
jgi:hypothetical protein